MLLNVENGDTLFGQQISCFCFYTALTMFGIERMWQFIFIILKLYFWTYNVWLYDQ